MYMLLFFNKLSFIQLLLFISVLLSFIYYIYVHLYNIYMLNKSDIFSFSLYRVHLMNIN